MINQVLIDGVAELTSKSGPILRFNVFFQPDTSNAPVCAVVPGFRIMSGYIHPPMAAGKFHRWYPVIYFGTGLAGLVYDAVVSVLDEKGWKEKYPLNSRDEATTLLTDRVAMMRLFPQMIGTL